MMIRVFNRYALSCLAVAMLSSCGASQLPTGRSGAQPQTSQRVARINASKYQVLYSFGGSGDGANPEGALIDVGGTLYGTTYSGGSYSCYNGSSSGCGTVFSVTTSGIENVLHRFGSEKDGFRPLAGLIDVRGILYGTTTDGGTYYVCDIKGKGRGYTPCGTVFSITTSGAEKVLHSFGGKNDGLDPVAPLTEMKGTLYGTTAYGGNRHGSAGTVFSVTPSGTEKVLFTFMFAKAENGTVPSAGLLDVGGRLYGTTIYGGVRDEHSGCGCGTVFSVTPGGKEKVLFSFGKEREGVNPSAALIDDGGALYGTTESGGSYKYKCNHYGNCGTVFSVTPSGKEKVLYSFGNGAYGADPRAALIAVGGTLYGTTPTGGAYSRSANGCGTVFSITPSGTLRVLHNFCSSSDDGNSPGASLINVNGTLYGTTASGGTEGKGTVFALTP